MNIPGHVIVTILLGAVLPLGGMERGLFTAIHEDNLAKAEKLISAGTLQERSASGGSLLHVAAGEGAFRIFRYLVSLLLCYDIRRRTLVKALLLKSLLYHIRHFPCDIILVDRQLRVVGEIVQSIVLCLLVEIVVRGRVVLAYPYLGLCYTVHEPRTR